MRPILCRKVLCMSVWDDAENRNQSELAASRAAQQAEEESRQSQMVALKQFVEGMERRGELPTAIPLTYDGRVVKNAWLVGWRIDNSSEHTAADSLLQLERGDIEMSLRIDAAAEKRRNLHDLIVTPDARLYRVEMKEAKKNKVYVTQEVPLPVLLRSASSFNDPAQLAALLTLQAQHMLRSGGNKQPPSHSSTHQVTLPTVTPARIAIGVLLLIPFVISFLVGTWFASLFELGHTGQLISGLVVGVIGTFKVAEFFGSLR